MAGAQTTIELQDKLTGPLMKMMRAMDNTIKAMESMDATTQQLDQKSIANAKRSIQSASAEMARLSSAANSANQNGVKPLQNQFTNLPGPVNRAKNSIKGFLASFAGAAAALLSIQALKQGFNKLASVSDSFISTKARLDLINDGLQTQEELQKKIFDAAQRSGAAYGDMSDSVAKLNMLAGDAFSSNDEVIRFGELMNKAFAVSGAGASEMQAGMHQLTQAMASGRLQGDEYVSIMENAPLLAIAIADSLGVTRGELKKLSSDGKITSDVIKAALFGAAQDIEEKFETMPITFSQAMTMIKNEGLMAFEPLLVRFSEFVNSDAFTTLSGHVMTFINLTVVGLMVLFDVIEFIYAAMSAVAEYWFIIAAGLGILLAVYFPAMLSWLWLMIEPILIQAAAWAIVYWPITLVVLAVIGLIGILMYLGITSEQILGFVGGLFFALGATIWNVIALSWNHIAMLAEFLINVFIDPVYAVQKLFYDMSKTVIDVMAAAAGSFDGAANALGNAFVAGANIAISAINGVIKALNMIPGVNIGEIGKVSAGAGSNLAGNLKNFASNLKAPTSSKGVVSIPRMDLKSIPGAWNSGSTKGSNLKMPGLGGSSMTSDIPNLDIGNVLGGALPNGLDNGSGKTPTGGKGSNPTGGKLDSIGKIDDKINIADEDLKLLKELADIRSIQNFKTLQPSFTFTGDMAIREEADLDKLADKLTAKFTEEANASAEGVYT